MSDPIAGSTSGSDVIDEIMSFAEGVDEPTDSVRSVDTEDPWEALGMSTGARPAPNSDESVTGEPVGEGDGEQEGEGDPLRDVDDPKSYKYFQSRYDQAQAYNEELRRQNELLQQALMGQSNTGQGVNQPMYAGGMQRTESPAQLQMPTKPEKPADFDRIEATTDPDSASFKYLQAMDAYRDEMDAFLLARHEQQERAVQIAQAQAAEEAQRQAYRHQLKHTFGLDDQRVERFFKVMDDPNILTLDNMVALFEIVEGNKPAARAPRKPASPTIPVPPIPSASGAGSPRQPAAKNPADAMFDDLLRIANDDGFSL